MIKDRDNSLVLTVDCSNYSAVVFSTTDAVLLPITFYQSSPCLFVHGTF